MTAGVSLEVMDIRHRYPNGTVALKGVNLAVCKGSIVGLVGANGAGKSSLVKILSGAMQPTEGTIRYHGVARKWRSPADALSSGIATIHQTVPLAPSLSVVENVFLGLSNAFPDTESEHVAFWRLTDRLGIELPADALVSELPIGTRQMICIVQALASGAETLILDEPTASLSEHDREVVFGILRKLRDDGVAIVFISHFLDEILDLCDRAVVLRDGQIVMERERGDLDEAILVEAIVGYGPKKIDAREAAWSGRIDGPPLLEVAAMTSPTGLKGISFLGKAGELIGVAGLMGSGRSELLHAIFGADPAATGEVRVAGRRIGRNISSAINAGLALVPEDRNRQSLFLNEAIWWNTSLPNIRPLSWRGLFPVKEAETGKAVSLVRELSIKADSADVAVGLLSGGNAQKVTIARWSNGGCKVFLLDEPFAGIDIGAKTEIAALLRRLAAEGCLVVVVDSDFDELLAITSRVLVLAGGRLVADQPSETLDEHKLLALASGVALDRPSVSVSQ